MNPIAVITARAADNRVGLGIGPDVADYCTVILQGAGESDRGQRNCDEEWDCLDEEVGHFDTA